MACALTAFSVKIVASGETAIKAAIAREAIYRWNADRSWLDQKAFLPLFDDEADTASTTPVDLLVALFRATRTTESDSAPLEEIARHLKSGRPALIYLSEARTDLKGADAGQLQDFKGLFPAEATVDSFKDEKEFSSKFTQKLEAFARYHPHFQVQGEVTPATTAPAPRPAASPRYSESAQSLLIDACDDPEAYLARMNDSRGLKIQVNGRQYIDPKNPASAAQWDAAFHELLAGGLIRDAGCNGQLFQISSQGFQFLETLGKHPIGYIAELGGM